MVATLLLYVTVLLTIMCVNYHTVSTWCPSMSSGRISRRSYSGYEPSGPDLVQGPGHSSLPDGVVKNERHHIHMGDSRDVEIGRGGVPPRVQVSLGAFLIVDPDHRIAFDKSAMPSGNTIMVSFHLQQVFGW